MVTKSFGMKTITGGFVAHLLWVRTWELGENKPPPCQPCAGVMNAGALYPLT